MRFLLSAAFVLCWSSGFIGAKLGAGSAPVVTLLMWRFLPLAAVLVLVAATFLEGRSRTRVAPSVSMTVHCTTSAVLFTALAAGTGSVLPPASLAFWAAVGWLVVLSTFGGYGLYWLILRRSGVTEVNTLMFLMAPVTALWGAAMFGEPFGPQTAAGLAVGLAAVVLVRRGATPSAASRSGNPAGSARGRTSGNPLVRPRAGDGRLRGVGRPGR